MAAAVKLAVPHSVFALGRVWPNPADPEEPYWLPLDREKVLVYLEWEGEKHADCGQHPHDWTDEHGIELEDPPFEIAEWHCLPCELLDDWAEARREHGDDRKAIFPALRRID